MSERVHDLAQGIFTVSGIFTPEECRDLIAYGEGLGFEAAAVTTTAGPKMMPDLRNNDRAMFDDPVFAESVWERVRSFVPAEIDGRAAVGLGERFRFYRYDPGQRFNAHRDGVVTLESGARSYLSFLIYLNTEYSGGETTFLDYLLPSGDKSEAPLRVRPEEAGMGLFFRHRLLHEGAEVTAGRKYVLRTDVFYGG